MTAMLDYLSIAGMIAAVAVLVYKVARRAGPCHGLVDLFGFLVMIAISPLGFIAWLVFYWAGGRRDAEIDADREAYDALKRSAGGHRHSSGVVLREAPGVVLREPGVEPPERGGC